jgi:hypothetical protein
MRTRATRRSSVNNSLDPAKRNLIIFGATAVGVIGLLLLLFLNLREPGDISGLMRHTGLSTAHNDNVVYSPSARPPAGGEHASAWQNCGIYETFIETKHVLHSLEHGAVWVTYRQDTSAADIAALQSIARNYSFILLSPYEGQEAPVVLTAWGLQLEVNSVTDRRIVEFLDRYVLGPQTLERGATCSGGVGEPIDRA